MERGQNWTGLLLVYILLHSNTEHLRFSFTYRTNPCTPQLSNSVQNGPYIHQHIPRKRLQASSCSKKTWHWCLIIFTDPSVILDLGKDQHHNYNLLMNLSYLSLCYQSGQLRIGVYCNIKPQNVQSKACNAMPHY